MGKYLFLTDISTCNLLHFFISPIFQRFNVEHIYSILRHRITSSPFVYTEQTTFPDIGCSIF